MGSLAHDKSEILFVIEFLFGGLIFFFFPSSLCS